MSEVSGALIGVAERERAMRILTHHVGTGRLSLTEFSDRTALAAAATTKAEMAHVLADLPIPVEAAPPDSATALPILGVTAAAITTLVMVVAVIALTTGQWLWLWLCLIAAIPAVLFVVRR